MCVLVRSLAPIFLSAFPEPRPGAATFSPVTRAHWFPQAGQAPFSLVPAWMQGRMSLGGKVAKWAPLNACEGTVQTERLARVA